jgi:alkylated DNA repair dioxygenase AlkB
MSSVSAAKSMTNALSAAIVASDKLPRTKVWGETDSAVSWQGAFAVYGGNGTTASSAIVYEVEPGKRLGWHTDATEETQYIIAGSGKLYLKDGTTHQVRPRQRVRAADADAPRSRECRQGNVARGRVLRRGDVHARL